jgi:hypothetical protein
MQIYGERCPNCSKLFYFPVDYPGGWFRTICQHCHLGYDLVEVMVDEELLAQMLCTHRTSMWMQKSKSQKLFQYLRSTALEFRFVSPTEPNAVLFQVAVQRSIFPIAIYFQSTYYRFQPLNRLLFSALLAAIGVLILIAIGLSLIPVVVGAAGALFCFWHFTALPKIKGVERHRLLDEQSHLRQCYQFGQNLNRIYIIKNIHQNSLQLRQLLLEKIIHAPELYPTQINLYQKAIQGTKDYLELCDRAIDKYQVAIRATAIHIETSKSLSVLASNKSNSMFESDLEQLENELVNSNPDKLFDRNHETDDH